MAELSERHKREAAIMALFKEEGSLSGNQRIQMCMSLDQLTDTELNDLEGFIVCCQNREMRLGYITSNIGHDIHGIAAYRNKPEEGFCPRTCGHAHYKTEEKPCPTGPTQE